MLVVAAVDSAAAPPVAVDPVPVLAAPVVRALHLVLVRPERVVQVLAQPRVPALRPQQLELPHRVRSVVALLVPVVLLAQVPPGPVVLVQALVVPALVALDSAVQAQVPAVLAQVVLAAVLLQRLLSHRSF
jgi:hypothetical protein